MLAAQQSPLDRRLALERPEAHLLTVASEGPAYLIGDFQVLTTGGSTGTRGVFVWDLEGFLTYALGRDRGTLRQRDGRTESKRAIVAASQATHATSVLARTFAGSPHLGSNRSVPVTLPFEQIVDGLNAFVGATVGEARGIIHVGAPRTAAGRRPLPLPDSLCELLAEDMRAKGLTGADVDEWLFQPPKAGQLRYSWWHRKIWGPAREAIDLPSLGFHDLRRVHATQLVESGVDLKVSQELMGHEDIRLTRGLYAQAGDELKEQANDSVAARLLNPTRDERAMTADNRPRRKR